MVTGPSLNTASLPVALACGWFWEDDDPDMEHVCIKAPKHADACACWCGTKTLGVNA